LDVLDEDDLEDKNENRRKQLRQYAARVEHIANKRSHQEQLGGDYDVPYRDPELKQTRRQQMNDVEPKTTKASKPRVELDSDVDEMYVEAHQRTLAKRTAKEEAKRARLSANPDWVDEDALDEDAKRSINYQILKNKGLAPKRKKEQRNPRVKHRKKYDKAQKKLKSIKPMVTQLSGAYGGEATGIKTDISRSVRF
jgi:U3 small nucleolar RNA-associated protein 3